MLAVEADDLGPTSLYSMVIRLGPGLDGRVHDEDLRSIKDDELVDDAHLNLAVAELAQHDCCRREIGKGQAPRWERRHRSP